MLIRDDITHLISDLPFQDLTMYRIKAQFTFSY